ncbi:MAG TPA: hypothetical protein VH142_24850 [Polyangiaceae bacterium]|nr:hypothetical protein [Polyangiaceae bacterium]
MTMPRTPLFSALLSFFCALAACSSNDQRPPGLNETCSDPRCLDQASISGQTGTGGVGGTSSVLVDGSVPASQQCTTDPTGHVTLCLATPECTGFVVDSTNFPQCGFLSGASTLSVECLCSGTQLCPIGVAAACTNLAGIFFSTTVNDVCNLVAQGRCQDLSALTGSGGSSSCDPVCASQCAGSPPCLQSCGC